MHMMCDSTSGARVRQPAYLDAPVRITIRRLVADSGSHTSPARPRIWRTSAPFSDMDDAVWRRTLAEGNVARAAGLQIEDAESPDLLGRVPDLAIRRRRDIVRVGAFGKLVDLPLRGLVLCSAGER